MSKTYVIFLSYPMAGKELSALEATRERLTTLAKHYFQYMKQYSNALDDYDDVEIIDNLYAVGDSCLELIGQAVLKMAKANAIFFANGSQNAKGCQVEYEIAKRYGIDIIDHWECWK